MRLLLALLVLLLVTPAGAVAHVTVVPEISRPGETGEFRFRTPNERDDAATVRLEVYMPKDVPVEAEPVRGWTITRIPGGVRWEAKEGVSIRPGRAEDFKVELGPLPDEPRLLFKALQYYADGQVVRWIQEPTGDAERPAALLDLTGRRTIGTDGAGVADTGDGPPWALIVAGGILLFIAALFVALLRA